MTGHIQSKEAAPYPQAGGKQGRGSRKGCRCGKRGKNGSRILCMRRSECRVVCNLPCLLLLAAFAAYRSYFHPPCYSEAHSQAANTCVQVSKAHRKWAAKFQQSIKLHYIFFQESLVFGKYHMLFLK